jgi:Zn ribbon nucleic-acid-binding protein
MDIFEHCPKCNAENTYELNVNNFLEHYSQCKFTSDVMVGDLIVKLKPLTYKKSTEFGLESFTLQKQIAQITAIEDEKAKNELATDVFVKFGILQNKILLSSVEYIETPDGVVSEYGFIKEWIDNCDELYLAKIKEVIDSNSRSWRLPSNTVNCADCGYQHDVEIDLDQASFFGIA